MIRHRWRYEGGRDAERNECRRCKLLVGYDWRPAADLDAIERVWWLSPRLDALRQPWPRRKPLPPCKGGK